ncbi:MAG: response regulator transcription factor [Bacteroidota bacterium]
MTAPARVLVAANSETLLLRLRLMVEAEGAEAVALGGGGSDGYRAVVAVPALAEQARRAAPGVPMIELDDAEDWDAVRRHLVNALIAPAATPEADALSAALGHARILLVDDSVTFREYLRHELVRLGAAVTVCGNADDAQALLAAGKWDCVLVDMVLPGVDGVELCGRAAQARRSSGGDYALVVLSSREGKADLIRSLEAGADLFLGKAQDLALIRVKLGALLRRRALMLRR